MLKSLPWIVVVLWMALIFFFSQQPAHISNSLSTTITEQLVETVQKIAPIEEVYVEKFNHIVRKNAHFFIYFFLGIIVFWVFNKTKIKGFHSIWIAFVFCSIYAVSDEFHQLFVPGRGAQLKDVLIDCAGAACGISLAVMIRSIAKNKKTRSKTE